LVNNVFFFFGEKFGVGKVPVRAFELVVTARWREKKKKKHHNVHREEESIISLSFEKFGVEKVPVRVENARF